MNQFDITLFQWLNSWIGISPLLDLLIIAASRLVWPAIAGAVILFVAISFFPRYRHFLWKNIEFALVAFFSTIVARFIITETIRLFYQRLRPFQAIADAKRIIDTSWGDSWPASFPSGHAALSFSVATVVTFYYPKTSIIFFIAAIINGIGRVAGGVHWPTDIMGGAIIGIVTACLIKLAYKRHAERKNDAA